MKNLLICSTLLVFHLIKASNIENGTTKTVSDFTETGHSYDMESISVFLEKSFGTSAFSPLVCEYITLLQAYLNGVEETKEADSYLDYVERLQEESFGIFSSNVYLPSAYGENKLETKFGLSTHDPTESQTTSTLKIYKEDSPTTAEDLYDLRFPVFHSNVTINANLKGQLKRYIKKQGNQEKEYVWIKTKGKESSFQVDNQTTCDVIVTPLVDKDDTYLVHLFPSNPEANSTTVWKKFIALTPTTIFNYFNSVPSKELSLCIPMDNNFVCRYEFEVFQDISVNESINVSDVLHLTFFNLILPANSNIFADSSNEHPEKFFDETFILFCYDLTTKRITYFFKR